MTLKLDNNDLRLRPGEDPTPERLAILFDAIQGNFEQLAELFPLQQANFANVLLLLVSTGTKRKVAFGSTSVTYSASNVSATKEVTHGLGATPQIVIPVALSFNADHNVTVAAEPGESKFSLVSRVVSGVGVTATVSVFWIAIG